MVPACEAALAEPLAQPALFRAADQALLRPGAFSVVNSEDERRAIVADLVRSGRLTKAQGRDAFLLVPVVGWAPTSAGAPIELTFADSAADAANLSSYTFSSISIGSASSDRLVIVGAHGTRASTNNPSATSVTIAGSGGSIHASAVQTVSGAALASRLVTAGTTATIGVSWNVTMARCAIQVWTLKNYASATPQNTDAGTASSSPSVSCTNTISAGGVAVYGAGAHHYNSGGVAWSSATERNDELYDSPAIMGAADKASATEVSSHVETATFASNAHLAMVSGVWL